MNIVVATSDAYLHCVRPFAYCLNKFWPGQSVKVLCYEKPLALPFNFEAVSVGPMEKYTWASGLMKFLEITGWEKFILMLDDYFLIAPVDSHRIQGLYAAIDYCAGKIDLSGDRMQFPHEDAGTLVRAIWRDGQGNSLYHPEGNFKSRLFLFSLQAAIWRTDFMRDYLDPKWGPWETEIQGTAAIVEGEDKWHILGTQDKALNYANMTKSGKPTLWRTDKGMPPELWEELKGQNLV